MVKCWLNTLKKTSPNISTESEVSSRGFWSQLICWAFPPNQVPCYRARAVCLAQPPGKAWLSEGNLFLISLSRKQRLSHHLPASFCTVWPFLASLIQFLVISASISAICFVDLSKYNCNLLTVKTVFITGRPGATSWILLQGPLYFIKYTPLGLFVFTFSVFDKKSPHIHYWNAHSPSPSASQFIISNAYVLSFTFRDMYLAATSCPPPHPPSPSFPFIAVPNSMYCLFISIPL